MGGGCSARSGSRMTADEKLKMLDQLIAEKMLETLYQLGESRSALNNQSVISYSLRGKAAIRAAQSLAAKIDISN